MCPCQGGKCRLPCRACGAWRGPRRDKSGVGEAGSGFVCPGRRSKHRVRGRRSTRKKHHYRSVSRSPRHPVLRSSTFRTAGRETPCVETAGRNPPSQPMFFRITAAARVSRHRRNAREYIPGDSRESAAPRYACTCTFLLPPLAPHAVGGAEWSGCVPATSVLCCAVHRYPSRS